MIIENIKLKDTKNKSKKWLIKLQVMIAQDHIKDYFLVIGIVKIVMAKYHCIIINYHRIVMGMLKEIIVR